MDAGVADNNLFVFANTGSSSTHVDGWPCVKNVCVKAGVSDPSRLTATRCRHRASTLYALEDASPEDRAAFYRHMGHAEDVNVNVYQCPPSLKEILKVAPYLEAIDGKRRKFRNLSVYAFAHFEIFKFQCLLSK